MAAPQTRLQEAQHVLARARSSPLAFQALAPLPQQIPEAFLTAAGVGNKSQASGSMHVGANVLAVLSRGSELMRLGGPVVACGEAYFEAPLEVLRLVLETAVTLDEPGAVSVPIGCCSDAEAGALPCVIRSFNEGLWEALREWQTGAWSPDTAEALWNAVLFVDSRRDLRLVTSSIMDWVDHERDGSLAEAERKLRAGGHFTYLFAEPSVARAGGPRCRSLRGRGSARREKAAPDLPFSLQISTEPEVRALAYGAGVGAGDRAANLVNLERTGVMSFEEKDGGSAQLEAFLHHTGGRSRVSARTCAEMSWAELCANVGFLPPATPAATASMRNALFSTLKPLLDGAEMGLPLGGGSLALERSVTASQLRAAVDALDLSRSRPRCATCNKALIVGSSFSCSRCRVVSYCGAACQRADWRAHKPVCSPPPPAGAAMNM